MAKRRRSNRHSDTRRAAVAAGFRSGYEQFIAGLLDEAEVYWEYESQKIKYQNKPSVYTPDFTLENGVIIEAKGRFTPSDRAKHLLIHEQHPDKRICLVFQYDNTLSKGSNTRYTEWCEKHGIPCAVNDIPREWLK